MAAKNGTERLLDAAMAQLIQNQAALVAQHAVFLSQMAEVRREFEAIRRQFEEIRTILLQHQRMLQELLEAIKRTIGFKGR